MDDLCTTCLCSGRTLHILEDTESYHMYLQILNDTQGVGGVRVEAARVCWECGALLRRFQRFRRQARRCQLLLRDQSTPKYLLSQPPRLRAQAVTSHSFPPLHPKPEPGTDTVKVELEDSEEHREPETFVRQLRLQEGEHLRRAELGDSGEEHREPESFVNELQVERSEDQDKPTKKKRKKLKSKKKKKSPEPVSDGLSDREVCDDGGKDGGEMEGREGGEVLQPATTQDLPADRLPAARDTRNKRNTSDKRDPGDTRDTGDLRPGERPTCAECGKVFSSRKTYRYHLNVLHRGQNRYPCPRCGKVYQWKSNLGRHLRTHKALDSGELHCAACDKRFASVATYRQHLRASRRHVAETEFSFVCAECGKRFVSRTRLRDHVDWDHRHHVKFRCHLCEKPFKCHTSLYVHLQNVHRDKEKKDNLCHVCGKSYQNAAKLKYHIVALHTRETPYACAQCGAAFGWYSSLYRHVREVHYKMKVQPKKSKKGKKLEEMAPPLPGPA